MSKLKKAAIFMYLDIDQNLEYIKVFFFFFSTLGSIVYAANIPVLYSLYWKIIPMNVLFIFCIGVINSD